MLIARAGYELGSFPCLELDKFWSKTREKVFISTHFQNRQDVDHKVIMTLLRSNRLCTSI